MEPIKNFKQLRMWRKGIDVAKLVYLLTQKFPREEVYGLTAQMRRSSISIPSNIAEGFKRLHKKEFRQFLHISLGSVAELETQAILANELNYLDEKELSGLLEELDHLGKMTTSYLKKIG